MKKSVQISFLICIIIFVLIICVSYSSLFIGEHIWTSDYKEILFMQNTQISFTPDNITIGIYHIEFWFTPIAEDIILQINEPLFLECEIEICQGKKTKSKKLNLTVDKGTLGKSRLLFVVPIEFMPNFMQEIIFTIKNVTFDVNFMNYYESIKFALVRSSMFFK